MPHATSAKDATTDLDPSEFRNVATFATVARHLASAAAGCFAYLNISADRVNSHQNELFKHLAVFPRASHVAGNGGTIALEFLWGYS